MEIRRLHDGIRNVQGQVSVIENKTQEKIVNWKQVIDDLSNKIHTKIDNLYTNLTKLMNQTINDTSNKINIKVDTVTTKPTKISQYTVMFTLFYS